MGEGEYCFFLQNFPVNVKITFVSRRISSQQMSGSAELRCTFNIPVPQCTYVDVYGEHNYRTPYHQVARLQQMWTNFHNFFHH